MIVFELTRQRHAISVTCRVEWTFHEGVSCWFNLALLSIYNYFGHLRRYIVAINNNKWNVIRIIDVSILVYISLFTCVTTLFTLWSFHYRSSTLLLLYRGRWWLLRFSNYFRLLSFKVRNLAASHFQLKILI